MTEQLSKALPSDLEYISNLQAARHRITLGKASLVNRAINNEGQADIEEIRKVILNSKNQEALRWHGNDPNIRLDECGFPKDRQDRKFLLSHDFGKQLFEILEQLKKEKWIYLWGSWGLGKTSLATRAIWESIKSQPSQKVTYISINSWINDQMPEGERYTPPLYKLVLLDDFDKFEIRSDFQVRTALRLIERLKERNSLVLITAQFSMDELSSKNKNHIDFQVMIDRIRGKSVVFNKFSGRSKR